MADTVDHILICVRDLEAAAAELRERYGLGWIGRTGTTVPGVIGSVIPLEPPRYIEMITVADRSASDTAERAARVLDRGGLLFTWVISPDDIEAVGRRVGVEPADPGVPGAKWRIVGRIEGERPFFLDYGTDRASRAERWRTRYEQAAHGSRPGGFEFIEVGGDRDAISRWVGEVDVPVRFVGGPPRLAGVGIASDRGTIVLRDAPGKPFP